MPHVEETDPEGVDFGWVMQVTFVTTILLGAPVVAIASVFVDLRTWLGWAEFAIRVGAVVWFCTSLGVYTYARYLD